MQRFILQLIVLVVFLLLATACSLLNSPRYGSDLDFEPATEATLTCSEECSLRGQCGTAVDQSVYVLGGIDRPLVENHDRLFPNDTRVTIKSRVPQSIQQLDDNQQITLNFYEVTASDLGKAGWVAGWCIAAP